MAKLICQSCGMPLKNEADYGTEKDGTHSMKYCINCYQNGGFTEPTISAKEMQKKVVSIMHEQMHIPPFLGKYMAKNVPNLERWKTADPKKAEVPAKA